MPSQPDNINQKYQVLIGTGGIGSGIFFEMKGEHTLGREESREGIFLNRRDYCKLHIIAHYVQVLLSPNFHSILISNVGDDPAGRRLLEEIKVTRMDTRYIQVLTDAQTLYSVCFLYPDGEGGNLTTGNSACSQVTTHDIHRASTEFEKYVGSGVALAAPEVPLEARRALLELATKSRFFRAGSFVSAEVVPALEMGLFSLLDLVSLNIDEAARMTSFDPHEYNPETIVNKVVDQLANRFPALSIALTAGKIGSWIWDGQRLDFKPSFPVQVVSTAGAGDAFLASLIAGTAKGLKLNHSHELGNLVAALSVTSPHTIAPEVSRETILTFANEHHFELSPAVQTFLKAA